jgi:hypothetical protein
VAGSSKTLVPVYRTTLHHFLQQNIDPHIMSQPQISVVTLVISKYKVVHLLITDKPLTCSFAVDLGAWNEPCQISCHTIVYVVSKTCKWVLCYCSVT